MRPVRHWRFGGSTAQLAGFPVRVLATLFRLPPSSILAKVANLEGFRPNGVRWDRPAAEGMLTAGEIGLDRAYSIVLVAARRAGSDATMLPDLLSG